MTSLVRRHFALLILFFGFTTLVAAQEKPQPLTDRELLALVAGNALNENVVHEIQSRGLAFHPSDSYRSQLTDAGADARVLAALGKATVSNEPAAAATKESSELLQHLSAAGKLIRSKKFQEAAQELDSALQSGSGAEAGFVMGELLRQQERWQQSAAVYPEVLQKNPDFPEVHTKLSYLMYRLGTSEEGLREAKAALARTPDNAEAHKNAGLALDIARKFDAAEVEYKEALRLKPDYQSVRYDLGILLYNKGDLDGAIAEYKKAIALDPNEPDVHYNLGNTYQAKGDISSAIREYREAKRLNPKHLSARHNLGSALIQGNFLAQAVIEFRELEAMAPESEICHLCLGGALYGTADFIGAEQEYGIAAKLDPSDPEPHIRLGNLHAYQQKYAPALQEYSLALQLDENSAAAHLGTGKVLLAKKDFANAVTELKQASELEPSGAANHDLYAQALWATGKTDAAITEFRQSLSLAPKETEVRLRFAAALEKNGNWVESLDQYRRAVLAGEYVDLGNHVVRVISPRPQDQLEAAELRFSQHLAALKAGGKSAEAAKLESSVAASKTNAGPSEKLDAAMRAAFDAMRSGKFNDAWQNYKEAVDLGEKMQPHDARLSVALGELGRITSGLKRYDEADVLFHRQLKVVEELSGPQAPELAESLQNLGMNEVRRKEYASARSYLDRALELSQKAYGETSAPVANALRMSSFLYFAQQDYAGAEPFLVRAVKIDETLYGHDGSQAIINLTPLCQIYDKTNRPDKAAPCHAHILAILEKQYGTENPILVGALTNEANALRAAGRGEEAAKLDQRIKTIQATAMNQN
jgi:tetratricopeptide (TPR) repeat protein